MKASEMKFEETLKIVCDALFAITQEGNYTILEIFSTPNSKTYQVNIYRNAAKPYDDDDTRNK